VNTELLKNVYMFRDLEIVELVEVLKISRQENFNEGKVIFLEGEPGNKFYIIESGEVGISKYIPNAGEEQLKTLKAGDYFGEMAIIDGSPRSATAIAKADTLCLVLDKAAMDGLLHSNHALGNKLLTVFCRTLSSRLRETNAKIASFIATTAGFGEQMY
jgi:CRP/FNR family transcriptional regulator, cyclic AMP receptor protein